MYNLYKYTAHTWQVRFLGYKTLEVCVWPIIAIVRWRLARPRHPRICGRKNEPFSSSRRLVSRSKTALGII